MIPTILHPRLIIISGPSGVGKNTLVDLLLKKYPSLFEKVVTNTTRKIRSGEVDGKDYHFISVDDFKTKINSDDLYEYVYIFENYYGCSKNDVKKIFNSNKIPILVIDVDGALNIKKQVPDSILIFITANKDQLESRLTNRGESSKQISKRLARLDLELSKQEYYDKIIQNDNLSGAFNLLEKYLLSVLS